MKILKIDGYDVLLDDEDFEIFSKFKWLIQHHKKNKRNLKYVIRFINSSRGINQNQEAILLHREIYSRYNKDYPEFVDHKDGNGLNNQKDNLRPATKSQNMMNRGKQINNTSGYKGITWDKTRNKWMVQIQANGEHIHIGRFTNIEFAIKAQKSAEIIYHGEFCWEGDDK